MGNGRIVRDLHLSEYVSTQIVWIIFGCGVLYKGLDLIAEYRKTGEAYSLPLGIASAIIGITIVAIRIFLASGRVGRMESKTPSDPDPDQSEHSTPSDSHAL